MAAIILFREIYWIRLIIDVPLIGLLIVGFYYGIYQKTSKNMLVFKKFIVRFYSLPHSMFFQKLVLHIPQILG